MTEKRTRNILNMEDLEKYAKKFGGGKDAPDHIRAWWNSTFRRFLIQEMESCRSVVVETSIKQPWIRIGQKVLDAMRLKIDLNKLIGETVKTVKTEELPEWAQRAISSGTDLWWFDDPGPEQSEKYRHWRDYQMTLPERSIAMTVEQMESAVKDWDKKLARQKLLQALSVGVTPVDPDFFQDDLFLVKLDTKEAYKAEGAVMKHCVADYWGRKSSEIYSLRLLAEDATPLATLEVSQGTRIVQVQGPRNQPIAEEHEHLLMLWSTMRGLEWRPGRVEYDDEDDDEDFDCDDEDEDDDDDDDGPRNRDDDDEEYDEDEDDGEWER